MSPFENDVVEAFHVRVQAACWDQLAEKLAQLHRPRVVEGRPVCHGCEREVGAGWPCRTYALVAASVLDPSDVERGFAAALEGAGVLEAVTSSR